MKVLTWIFVPVLMSPAPVRVSVVSVSSITGNQDNCRPAFFPMMSKKRMTAA